MVRNSTSNAIYKFEKKTSGKGADRVAQKIILVMSNEDVNGIIKIMRSLKDSAVLIDAVTETVKHEIRKKNAHFLKLCEDL